MAQSWLLWISWRTKKLLIQDDAVEAKAVSEALHGSFRVDWVKHCSEGVERLARGGKREEQGISAVLVDLFLADSQGIETFDQLFRVAPRIPILILCAGRDEDVAKRVAPSIHLVRIRNDVYYVWRNEALTRSYACPIDHRMSQPLPS
jgi:CheY-like chemotaxis protein